MGAACMIAGLTLSELPQHAVMVHHMPLLWPPESGSDQMSPGVSCLSVSIDIFKFGGRISPTPVGRRAINVSAKRPVFFWLTTGPANPGQLWTFAAGRHPLRHSARLAVKFPCHCSEKRSAHSTLNSDNRPVPSSRLLPSRPMSETRENATRRTKSRRTVENLSPTTTEIANCPPSRTALKRRQLQ